MHALPLPFVGRGSLRRRLRLTSLTCAAVVLAGAAIVSLPSSVSAAEVTTRIDQEHPNLSTIEAPAVPDAAAPSTAAPLAPAGPLTPDQAQLANAAAQPGRLHALSEGIAPFTLLGISARTPANEPALVRVHHGGVWGPWTTLAFDGGDAPDPSSAEGKAAARATGGVPTTEGLWFGTSDGYELSLPAGSTGLTVQLARESTTRVTRTPQMATTAALDTNQPAINRRSSWGARPPKQAYDYAPSVEHAIVHHSVTQNVYAPGDVPGILRSIQAFHMDTRGWNDIAYNFAVDKFGGVWEARGGGTTSTAIGGHALGANTSTTGIVTLGDFSTASPPQVMIDSLGDLIGWKLYTHGIDPQGSRDYVIRATDRYPEGTHIVLPSIIGHRDVGLTGCPGDYLYPRLADIRARAAAKFAQLKTTIGAGTPAPFSLLEVNSLGKGTHDAAPTYTLPAGRKLACHLDGYGVETPVTFSGGVWSVTDDPAGGGTKRTFSYGNSDDIPVCGDWDGNGTETPGLFRNGVWYLTNTVGKSTADVAFAYGDPTDVPIVGDWDGNGTTTPGVARNGTYYLANTSGQPTADIVFGFGDAGDKPLVGDWDGNGSDTLGFFRAGTWFLTNTNGSGVAEISFAYGDTNDVPLVGDWNGDHQTTPALIR